ncbi:MAG TPA: hypothetical protein PKZ97_00330 [Azospirillaceae bacterium]|nr:hypothetical protein [Azospirillaceae bacterium]
MDEFVRKYQGFILSSLYLVLALLALGYATLISPREIAQESAVKLAAMLNSEIASLKKEQQVREETKKQPSVGVRSLPAFLEHINNTARETDIIIKELIPGKDGDLKFVLKVTSDYFKFLKLAAKLEKLNLTINDLQVRPYKMMANPPEHVIEFSLTPRGDAEPLSSGRFSNLDELVSSQSKRNPFQRFAFNSETKAISRDIDLTWIYHMTSVGKSGGKEVTTIDGAEYFVGGRLKQGHVITAITGEEVRLEQKTDNGLETSFIRFRKPIIDGAR